MIPLRKCRFCGLEAYTVENLELFTKGKEYLHNRRNYCKVCFAKHLRKGGKYYKKHNEASVRWNKENDDRIRQLRNRRFSFKNNRVYLEENPRNNVCSKCGRKYPEDLKRQTDIHHDVYHRNNPLANTQELCLSCHIRLHRKLDIEKGIPLFGR